MEVVWDIEWLAAVAIVSLQLEEVDELQDPFLLRSFQGLLASRAMCSEQGHRRSTCRDLVGQEPKKKSGSNFGGCRTYLLTLPTKLSAEPITSNELGRAPCGLDGVD